MYKYICKYCLENFKNSNELLKHQEEDEICIKYRNIIFVCNKCNFSTIGIKIIESHLKDDKCICDNISAHSDEFIIEDSDTEENNKYIELQNKLLKLENDLKKEKIKNDALQKIIETDKITLNINTTEKQTEKELLKPVSPTNSYKSTDDENEPVKDIKNSLKSFKILKNTCIELSPEIDKQEIDLRIKDIDLKIYNTKQSFGNIEQCKMIFKRELEFIKTNRVINKNLEILKNTRRKLIGAIPIEEYTSLVKNHIDTLKTLLEIKGHQDKRIHTTIIKSLNSLDTRLVFYTNYYNTQMDTEEYVNFKSCLELFVKTYSYYNPFNFDEFINQFYNYGSVVIPIKSCIEFYISNRYGFNNVIYVPLRQSLDSDPYSFYTLEAIIKEKRYWKMDCRLVDLSDRILVNLRNYLIKTFRKIYFDIFNDNEYREDYDKKTNITANDCNQLLTNIFTLSNNMEFYNLVRNIIKDNATYKPTENDKFNLYGDELVLKKRFSKKKDNNDNIDIVKSLFDNITSEQAVDLFRSKSSC